MKQKITLRDSKHQWIALARWWASYTILLLCSWSLCVCACVSVRYFLTSDWLLLSAARFCDLLMCTSTVCYCFRNTVPEMVVSILLALGVCFLGSVLLSHGFFHDFAIFWLCFVIAGCQYSLLKVCWVTWVHCLVKKCFMLRKKASLNEIVWLVCNRLGQKCLNI